MELLNMELDAALTRFLFGGCVSIATASECAACPLSIVQLSTVTVASLGIVLSARRIVFPYISHGRHLKRLAINRG